MHGTIENQVLPESTCSRYIAVMARDQLPAPEARASQCPSAAFKAGIDLLQEKWVLSIVYVLLSGPAGFNDMARNAGDVNSTTLAQRLARLEGAGLVTKTVAFGDAAQDQLRADRGGPALKPVIQSIEKWAQKHGATCDGHKSDAA